MIAGHALSAYLAAAIKLRETAEWNRFDANFQGKAAADRVQGRRGRLVPLVDANIVKFFMDPDHEVRLVNSFANLHDSLSGRESTEGAADEVPPQHLVTFARVTAEFLFLSSAVSIGNEVRQLWREAPMIAPVHAEETASMLHQIERKIADVYRRVARMTEAEVLGVDGRRATQTVAALHAGQTDHQAFQKLVREMSGSFEELFDSKKSPRTEETRALEEGSRWLRLMRGGKLRPLLSHPLCEPQVLNPPTERVKHLAEMLLVQKRKAAWSRNESSTRVSQLAWRDATVVVQTTMLNELARQRQTDDEEIRFILISGDETLHSIYADQFWRDPSASPEYYVLRRPLQYIPIMNARDIPNGYQAMELFDTLLAVLDTITDFVTQRTCNAFALDHDFRHRSYKLPRGRGELEMPPLQQLANLWLEAIIASNALCAGLAVHDFGIKELVESLDQFAGDQQALRPLIDLHEQIFRDIDGIQLPLIAQELLADAVGALRRHVQAADVGGVRIPLLIRERFEAVTGNLPIDKFVTRLAQGRGGTNIAELHQAMRRWPRQKALFFAGTVAAVANNFDRAAGLLSHTVQLLRANTPTPSKPIEGRPNDLDEVLYLQCVVDRLRMCDEAVFDGARRRLDRLIDSAHRGSFEYARALSEEGSLYLMRYFNVKFDIEKGASVGVAEAMVERSKVRLEQAQRASLKARARRVDLPLIQALDTQIHTNTIAWHVVRSGFFDGHVRQIKDFDTSLDILENVRSTLRGGDHIIGFWESVGSWLIAPPEQRADRAKEVADFCHSRLRALKALGAEYQAPADFIVFSFVAEQASLELAS